MPFDLEWRMWRQLRGAFEIEEFIFVGEAHDGYTFRQALTMKEALAVLPADCQRVLLGAGEVARRKLVNDERDAQGCAKAYLTGVSRSCRSWRRRTRTRCR